jgi:hypothetical protein
MSSEAAPTESDPPRQPPYLIIALAVLIIGLPIVVYTFSSRPVSVAVKKSDTSTTEDQLQNARETLRKETTLDACRAALSALGLYVPILRSRSNDQLDEAGLAMKRALVEPSEATVTLWRNELKLTEREINELLPLEFSPLDPHHLENALYFRDIARGLDLASMPPLERAKTALTWVTRQVYLAPSKGEPLPGRLVLRRGFGQPLERAYVFLALARQLKLDACLVGTASQPWGIGVLVEGEVQVLDPAQGEALGTLTQVRSNPDRFKGKSGDAGPTAEQAKTAELLLTGTLSALSPRMHFAELAFGPSVGVRLYTDAGQLRERFRKAGRAAGLSEAQVNFYNPIAGQGSPWRVEAELIPTSEGGFDSAAPGKRRIDLFNAQLVPLDAFPKILQGKAGQTRIDLDFQLSFTQSFIKFYAEGASGRSRLHRGDYEEAAKVLTTQLREFETIRKRLEREPTIPAQAQAWRKQFDDLLVQITDEQRRLQRDKQKTSPTLARLDAELGKLLERKEAAELMLNQAIAQRLEPEVLYLLGLTKLEQAEQLARQAMQSAEKVGETQVRGVQEAANNAASWFGRYLERSDTTNAARTDHVRRLLARAQQLREFRL